MTIASDNIHIIIDPKNYRQIPADYFAASEDVVTYADTRWFDYSADLDVEGRAKRKAENGVIIEPWAIKENSLDYLCEEYSMRSLMYKKFGLEEVYLGLAVQEHDFFEKLNENPDIDLTIPQVRPITLTEVKMEHVEKLGRAVPANPQQRIPIYARGLRLG